MTTCSRFAGWAIAALSPWSAAAAAFGATLAVLLGRRFFAQNEWEWKEGFGTYDCVLLGIAWGGALSRGAHMAFLLSLAILACLAMRGPIVRRFNFLGLPALALPGLIATWLSISVFGVFGSDFWLTPPINPFGARGPAVAIIAVAVGMFLKHPRAAVAAAMRECGRIPSETPFSISAVRRLPYLSAVFRRTPLAQLVRPLLAATVWLAWTSISPLISCSLTVAVGTPPGTHAGERWLLCSIPECNMAHLMAVRNTGCPGIDRRR